MDLAQQAFAPDPTDRPASVIQDALKNRPEDAKDPALRIKGMAPNFGEFVLPHVTTFQAVVSSAARVYRASDEAIKDSVENARYMRNDCSVMECMEQRQRSTALLGWHLEADNEKDRLQSWLCGELTAILEATPRWMQYRENLLHAIWYGKYGVSNVYRWKKIRGNQRLVIDAWRPINGDKLAFRWDNGAHTYLDDQVGIRVGAGFMVGQTVARRWTVEKLSKVEATDVGLAYFLEPWERNLIAIHKHYIEDGAYEDPWTAGQIHGVGVRSRIYWSWMQMQETLAWLMEYLERSAFGIEIWYYPWGNQAAEEKTRKAAQERIGQGRNVVLVPRPLGEEGMSYGVERIEPGMAGVDACQRLVTEFFGHRIKRYILGQTLTSEAGATGLGSNLADIHLASYLSIIKYDAINLEESITTEVVKPLLLFNFPQYRDIPIRFRIDTEAADVEAKLQAWRQAYDMGVKLKAQEVMDLIGASKPEEGDEVLQNPQAAQAAGTGQPGQPQPAGRAQGAMPGNAATADELWRNLQVEQLKQTLGEKGMLAGENGQQDQPDGDGDAGPENYDRLPGGAGDNADPSQFDRAQVQEGVRHEMEHTRDPGIALEIALDHLSEDPQYYGQPTPTSESSERKRIVEAYRRPASAFIPPPSSEVPPWERYQKSAAEFHRELSEAIGDTAENPSEAQKKAGNYRKGKLRLHGLEISIENPAGSIRSGVGADGKPWSTEMLHHYGYIKRTESEADGDHVDVFLGPHPDSEIVFVVDQTKAPSWRNFDEHKVMIGWTSAEKAKQAYLDSYSDGWNGFESITPMTIGQFKAWLAKGDTGRRAAEQVTDKYVKADRRRGSGDGPLRKFRKSDQRRIDEHLAAGRGELIVTDESGAVYGYTPAAGGASVVCYSRG